MTTQGVILGTAAYMAPEQARGKAVDNAPTSGHSAASLYEMLTGRVAFPGETVTDTLAAVLEREPSWSDLPPDTPPAVRRLLQRCLEKEPRRRLRDIGDARAELDLVEHDSVIPAPATAKSLAWLGILVIALAAFAIGQYGQTTSNNRGNAVVRSMIDIGPAQSLLGAHPGERELPARSRPSRTAIALSPDGKTLAFTAQRDGVVQLYVSHARGRSGVAGRWNRRR